MSHSNQWTEEMRADWDLRARENTLRHMYRRGPKELDAFYEYGRQHALSLTFSVTQKYGFDARGKKVLELGCGVGRLFGGFQEMGFREIWGVDISPEVVERGRLLCPVPGAHFMLGDGESLKEFEPECFDYCFSYNVFPCVPSTKIIWQYLQEVHRVLKPQGVFQLHFRQGINLKARILCLLPDNVRPYVRSLYSRATLSSLRAEPTRSIEEVYAAGNLRTWLGASLSPAQVRRRVYLLGFANVTVFSDPLDNSDGKTFWVAGQKP